LASLLLVLVAGTVPAVQIFGGHQPLDAQLLVDGELCQREKK
jgi:hypothetical protein